MLEPPRKVPYATWPGTLAVLAALVVLVGGLQAWDRRVPGHRDLQAGETVVAGQGARFMPAPGWQMNLPRSRAGTSLTLFKDGASFVVSTAPWRGGEEGPMARQLRVLERARGLDVDGEPEPFLNAWGLQGRTLRYYGPTAAGRYWQIVDEKRGVVVHVDFHGSRPATAALLAEAREMVDSIDLLSR